MPARPSRLRPAAIVIGAFLVASLVGQPQSIGPRPSGAPVGTPTTTTTGGGALPSTYYVAPNGNDTNSGLTLAAAFRTITKCAQVATAGYTCLIAAGTYNETVTPAYDGTAGSPITFRPYQQDVVTVSGADALPSTAWTAPQSGSIWTASVALPAANYSTSCTATTTLCANQVFVDGVMLPEARWPNPGTTPISPTLAWTAPQTFQKTGTEGTVITNKDSHVANSSEPGADSNGWAGATVVIWPGSAFYAESGTVITSTTGSLSAVGLNYRCIAPTDTACPNATNQWYVTGLPVFLSSAGMWSYNASTTTLSVWFSDSGGPSGHTILVKDRNYAFDLAGRSYITISGLNVFGATIRTTASSTHDTLDTLAVTYPSHYVTTPNVAYGATSTGGSGGPSPQTFGIDWTGLVISGTSNMVQNSTISLSAGNGIALLGSFNSAVNNFIANVDYAGGYGAGIAMVGHDLTASHNTIHDTGRDGIELGSSRYQGYSYPCNCAPNYPTFANNSITYNDVWHSMMIANDGGEMYGCCELAMTGTVLAYNFAHDHQAHLAVTQPAAGAGSGAGIYIDNSSFGTISHHDVTWGNGTSNPIGMYWNRAVGLPNYAYNNTLAAGDKFQFALQQNQGQGITNTIMDGGLFNGNGSGGNYYPFLDHDITGTVPYVDSANHNYQLASNASTAIDQGVVVPNITGVFTTTAPSIGAYQFGQPPWRPGCSFAACADALTTAPVGSTP